jgi:hypothetical protein
MSIFKSVPLTGTTPMARVGPLDNLTENQVGGTSEAPPSGTPTVIFRVQAPSTPIAEVLTVVLSVTNPENQMASGLVGTVTWGIGGANFSAQFDVMQGTAFSIPANFLTVSVTNPVLLPTPNPTVNVSAGVAYGTLALTSAPLRLTVPLTGAASPPFTVNNGDTAIIPIPPFAVAFVVNATTPAAAPGTVPPFQAFLGPIQVNQVDIQGNAITSHTITSSDTASNQFENAIPLMGSPSSLAITNGNGAPAQMNVTFVLAL